MSLTDEYYFEVELVKWRGRLTPRVKWLLTDFDTWESNPHYKNPKPWLVDDSHPEDIEPRPVRLHVVQCNAYGEQLRAARACADDELPF